MAEKPLHLLSIALFLSQILLLLLTKVAWYVETGIVSK